MHGTIVHVCFLVLARGGLHHSGMENVSCHVPSSLHSYYILCLFASFFLRKSGELNIPNRVPMNSLVKGLEELLYFAY